LANIVVQGNKRDSYMQDLQAQLNQTSHALTNKLKSSLNVRGISMGGPTPPQVALDWNFTPVLENCCTCQLEYHEEENE